MEGEELLREITVRPRAAVPLLLAREYPDVLANLWPLIEACTASPRPQPPLVAAGVWMIGLSITQGSVSVEEPPALTRFGEALLEHLVLTVIDEEMPPFLPVEAEPTGEELERLNFELWGQTTVDNPQGLPARVLARLVRCAIALAPERERLARMSLATTALVLAEHLTAIVDDETRPLFAADCRYLRAAAGSVFPPDDLARQARDAATMYRNLPELARLQEALPREEYERAAYALMERANPRRDDDDPWGSV